jgi:hypothetical protein
MIQYFLLTLWVGLFSGGDFSVGVLPDRYSVTISEYPKFNWVAYSFLSPDDFRMEYEISCVHIVGYKSHVQYVKTFDDKVLFDRLDASMVVFSVKYRPVGRKRSDGSGTAVGMGQKKFVFVGNFPTQDFGLYGN